MITVLFATVSFFALSPNCLTLSWHHICLCSSIPTKFCSRHLIQVLNLGGKKNLQDSGLRGLDLLPSVWLLLDLGSKFRDWLSCRDTNWNAFGCLNRGAEILPLAVMCRTIWLLYIMACYCKFPRMFFLLILQFSLFDFGVFYSCNIVWFLHLVVLFLFPDELSVLRVKRDEHFHPRRFHARTVSF